MTRCKHLFVNVLSEISNQVQPSQKEPLDFDNTSYTYTISYVTKVSYAGIGCLMQKKVLRKVFVTFSILKFSRKAALKY